MNLRPDPDMGAAARPLMSDRRVALIGAVLAVIGPISMMLFTPAMPELVRVFGTSEAVIKLALASYFAGFAVAQLVCGPLSDGFGRKPIVMAFMAIYLVATGLALIAPNAEALIGARFMQGVGAAVGLAIARALVRDLYTTEKAVGVMNLIVMMLSVGPLLAPALGGFTMEFASWQAIFWLMGGMGMTILLVVHFGLVETVPRDLSRIRPRALAVSYGTLLTNRYFVLSSMIVACSLGAIYTQATLLPFILMDRLGLSPMEFGFAMVFQSLAFLAGNITLRMLMRRYHSSKLVPFGLVFVLVAVALMPLPLMGLVEASLATVMGPVAIYCFGVAFIMPTLSTSALAPFPTMAGAAASMGGFLQMAAGLAGALVAGVIGDPLTAFSIVVPLMGILAALSWGVWRKMPEPALARVTAAPDRPTD